MGGGGYYWHLGELWARAGIDSALTPSQWQESWWPQWKIYAERLGLEPLDVDVHLRRAAPTRKARGSLVDPRSGLIVRILPAASCSSWFLFALLARLTASSGKKCGRKSADTVASFRVLVKSMLTHTCLRSQWVMRLFLDSHARCSPEAPPSGHCPVDFVVAQSGHVDISALRECGHVGEELLCFFRSDTVDLIDLLPRLWEGGESRFFLLKQVVWHLVRRFEHFLDRGREDLGAAHPFAAVCVQSDEEGEQAPPQKKPRHQLLVAGRFAKGQAVCVSRQARIKYFFSMRRHFASGTFVSVCIDASRLRREGVLVGAIAQPNNVAAWLPPQVSAMVGRCPTCLGSGWSFHIAPLAPSESFPTAKRHGRFRDVS